jgi:hypothetical protein
MCLKQSGAQEEKLLGHQKASAQRNTGICSCILNYVFVYHNEHGIKADRVVQHFATDTIMIKAIKYAVATQS